MNDKCRQSGMMWAGDGHAKSQAIGADKMSAD